MVRLTDEQRDVCAEHVPLARRLAARYAARCGLGAQATDDVTSTFLLALPIVVAEYDPDRGASMATHLRCRLAHRALDLLRAENGRPGKLSHRMRAATVSLDYRLGTDPDGRRALTVGDTVPDTRAARPAAEVEFADALAACREHVGARELYLLVQSFIAGRSLADVGREFGFGTSRASQMRSQAVKKLLAVGALEGQ
jgi:RNA polymerase sigma factor (sigma-70 family)